MKFNINKHILLFLSVFTLLIFLFSCKTKRAIIQPNTDTGKAKTYIDKHRQTKADFSTLSIRFAAQYKSGSKGLNFNGQLRIKKDSLIWFSLSPGLGIELFRGILTKDSIFYINKLEGTYFAGDYGFIEKNFKAKLNFNHIQSIITNTLFAYESTEKANINEFETATDSGHLNLYSHSPEEIKKKLKSGLQNKPPFVTEQITINQSDYTYTRLKINDHTNQRKINIDYSGFTIVMQSKLFPEIIKMQLDNQNVSEQLQLKYQRVLFNSNLSFPFSIPSKYKRI